MDKKSTVQVSERDPLGVAFDSYAKHYIDNAAEELRELKSRLVVTRDRTHPVYVAQDTLFEFPGSVEGETWVQLHSLFDVKSSIYIFVCTYPKGNEHQTVRLLDDMFDSFRVEELGQIN